MYIDPSKVISPKSHWKLNAVLHDTGEDGCAYAIGTWDGERRIGFRWNGNATNPLGNPQSRGLPTWTMLDPKLHDAVLSLLPWDRRALARRFFGTAFTFDGVTMSSDRSSVVLWNVREQPPIVAVVGCRILRKLVPMPTMSDEDCRLVADVNKELLSGVADAVFCQDRHKTTEHGKLRVIEIQESDLELVAAAFSSRSATVLQLSAFSGWR